MPPTRAVSEVVAAILLSLIMISLGTIFLINYLEQQSSQQDTLESTLELLQELSQEALIDILYTYYNTTPGHQRLEIVVSTGEGITQVVGIYLNNTLIWNQGDPNAFLNGTQVNGPLILDDSTILNITLTLTLPLNTGDTYTLVLTTSTGTKAQAQGEAA